MWHKILFIAFIGSLIVVGVLGWELRSWTDKVIDLKREQQESECVGTFWRKVGTQEWKNLQQLWANQGIRLEDIEEYRICRDNKDIYILTK